MTEVLLGFVLGMACLLLIMELAAASVMIMGW